jgi:hypothetical protein
MATLVEQFLNRFGLDINKGRNLKAEADVPQFSPPDNEDGALQIPAGPETNFVYQISLDAQVSSESQLINQYRQVSLFTEPDLAVSEIVNEAIVMDDDKASVEINLDGIDNSELPEATKKEIVEEFEEILRMLNFKEKGIDIFQRWYIDSRLIYHKLVNPNNTKVGIKGLKFLDPRKVRKIKEVEQIDNHDGTFRYKTVDEYFLYFETAFQYDKTYGGSSNVTIDRLNASTFRGNAALKINKDSIAYITSGMVDPSTGVVYGYLQKCLRPFNQLRWAEDSALVQRIGNSTDTRVIYVDIGKMNPKNAEKYMASIQNNYKNKLSYDVITGNVKTDARVMSVQENIWLPRIDGQKSTEIQNINNPVNFGDIADIEYWKEKLYNSLRVPPGRFKSEGIQMVLGQSTEVSREELKFSKFINKIRRQFSHLFDDILKTQLILKEILTEQEWEAIQDKIQYNFIKDSYYTEAKEQELLTSRLEALAQIEPYVGKYFSHEYVQKNILRMSDEDILQNAKQIELEKNNPQFAEDTGDGNGEDGLDDVAEDKPSKEPPKLKIELTEPGDDKESTPEEDD